MNSLLVFVVVADCDGWKIHAGHLVHLNVDWFRMFQICYDVLNVDVYEYNESP